jgi:hypothetical protein
LFANRREIAIGLGQAVLQRLEHRLDRGERRAEIVARPGDELPAGIEQLLQLCRHLVERKGELVEL